MFEVAPKTSHSTQFPKARHRGTSTLELMDGSLSTKTWVLNLVASP